MLSSSLNKFSRKSFIINNSSLSIPELINDSRLDSEFKHAEQAKNILKHFSENDLLDNTATSENYLYSKFGNDTQCSANTCNTYNMMMAADEDDDYEEYHTTDNPTLKRNSSENYLFFNYEEDSNFDDMKKATRLLPATSNIANRVTMDATVADESINFCKDVDFNVDLLHLNNFKSKPSENYSSNVNLAKINESDDQTNQENENGKVSNNVNKQVMLCKVEKRFGVYQFEEEKTNKDNLRKSKYSFKLIQSARSSTSSILSIERFKRMKSKRRSSSSQTSERANNRKIVYAKNLLEQIQNLYMQSNTHGTCFIGD